MGPSDLASFPWAALLIGLDGELLAASPSVASLLGAAQLDLATLHSRYELATGGPIAWRRAGRPGAEVVACRDRVTGRSIRLHTNAIAVEGGSTLVLLQPAADSSPEGRVQAMLSALNEALLVRPGEVTLRDLLARLVAHTCELTHARYGAIGVLKKDGSGLQDFIYVGISPEDAARIGHLPRGLGLLGAVIREQQTIRVADLGADPRRVGFPPHHPPMRSFLGAPLRLGNEGFGNFYLTEKRGAPEFSAEDARLLEQFSAQAALTVAFARQVEDSQRRLLEAVIQSAPNGIVFFPAEPGIESFGNAMAASMLGTIVRGVDPGRGYDLAFPDGRLLEPHELPSSRALAGEMVINLELLVRRRDRPEVPALVSAAPVRTEHGTLLGAMLVLQDITTLKELERLRQEFATMIAHDLRTPVQAVMLQLDALLRRAAGAEARVPVAILKGMKRSSVRLAHLIGDLLDTSRIESHRLTVVPQPVDVPALVAGLVQQLGPALGDRRVLIEARTPHLPRALADPVRLEQILTNLLDNAAKYSPPGTPIRVSLDAAGGGVVVGVRDEGAGIAPEDLPHLFDRYYQVARARQAQRGLGLGLYITKALVEAHRGRLQVESTPGAGSVFRVWLPRA
ncbi:MAG TPA: ATP-binding protein [Polyangia bacterium]|jgi:signal transduction histidine kinase